MIDEGYIKFDIDWHRSAPLECPEIDELNRWREPLYAAGLIGHYDDLGIGYGNISVRRGSGGDFVISGTQTGHVRDTGAEHYALVSDFDLNRNRLVCRGPVKASSESLTHAALYASDADIHAVVHVHDKRLWTESRGKLPTTPPDVEYGTPAMARALMRLCEDEAFRQTGIAVMAGHEGGLIAVGGTLREAATRILDLAGRPGGATQKTPIDPSRG